MVVKSVVFSCPECGSEYTIISATWESIQYCPFCGADNTLPYDDMVEQEERERLNEDDFEESLDDAD